MIVFIENEAGKNLKHIHNEKTFEYIETIKVSREYPFPYGFILNTTGEDGDNVDVFIITEKNLKRGEIVEVEILGLMEQFEKSWDRNQQKEELDHNVIAKLKEESNFQLDETVKERLNDFVLHVFDNIQLNKTRLGRFLDREAALEYIISQKDV